MARQTKEVGSLEASVTPSVQLCCALPTAAPGRAKLRDPRRRAAFCVCGRNFRSLGKAGRAPRIAKAKR
jgi:hypothetical protein